MQTLKKRRTKVADAGPLQQYRIQRFHLSSERDAVVTPHPQALSKRALEQGYIVLRFEPAASDKLRDRVVELLNGAELLAIDTWVHR